MSKNIVTKSGAKYTVTSDGAVTRERGETNIEHTHLGRQYTEGFLITNYNLVSEGASFMWYAFEDDAADVIRTSAIVSVEETL